MTNKTNSEYKQPSVPQGELEAKLKVAVSRIPSLAEICRDHSVNSRVQGYCYKFGGNGPEIFLDVDSLETDKYKVAAVLWGKEWNSDYGWSYERILNVHYTPKGSEEQTPKVLEKSFWEKFRGTSGGGYDARGANYEAKNLKLTKLDDSELSLDVTDPEGKTAINFRADLKSESID